MLWFAAQAAYARAAQGVAAQVSFVEVPGGEHTMVRHLAVFDTLAAGFVTGTLLGRPVPADGDEAEERLVGVPPLRV